MYWRIVTPIGVGSIVTAIDGGTRTKTAGKGRAPNTVTLEGGAREPIFVGEVGRRSLIPKCYYQILSPSLPPLAPWTPDALGRHSTPCYHSYHKARDRAPKESRPDAVSSSLPSSITNVVYHLLPFRIIHSRCRQTPRPTRIRPPIRNPPSDVYLWRKRWGRRVLCRCRRRILCRRRRRVALIAAVRAWPHGILLQ